jgi:phosphoribosylglycinamide formyltransferase-1
MLNSMGFEHKLKAVSFMKKIVFLNSGMGSNLRLVHSLSMAGYMDIEVTCVIADRDCGALDYARSMDIRHHKLSFDLEQQDIIVSLLSDLNPDIIVTNVHRILSPKFVLRFSDQLINLHYSLLPAFGGHIDFKPVSQALSYGVKLIGSTCHRVTNELDKGTPLAQSVFNALPDEKKISEFVFLSGGLALIAALSSIAIVESEKPSVSLFESQNRMFLVCPGFNYSNILLRIFEKEFSIKVTGKF